MSALLRPGPEPPGWDEAVAAAGTGGFFQTTRWARLLRVLRGSRAWYLQARNGQGPAARCLVLQEGLLCDRLRRVSFGRFLVPALGGRLPVLSWQNGPLVAGGSPATCDEVLDQVDAVARTTGALAVRFAPFPATGAADLGPSLAARGYRARRCATFWVDLQSDYEARLDRSVRKNVRRCREQGVWAGPVAPHEYPQYYRLQQAFRRATGLPGFSFRDFLLHAEHLGPVRCLFAARWRGRLLAGLGVLAWNGLLVEVEAATNPLCYEERLHAQDLLKVEIMAWGRERGFGAFDLAGVAVEPQDAKEEGIRRFKAKFGGQYLEFDAYERRASGWRARLARGLAPGAWS
ncbi:MAG: hypothetical protein AB1505_21945 [Candidatus Latescibacterota bacterium]